MATISDKSIQSIFLTDYRKCTCKSKTILSTLYTLETFRYDTLSLSMTISHLQIAVFLNSHPAVGLRPTAVVMAGLRPAMTTGGLDKVQIWLLYIDLELQSIPVLIDVTQIKFDVECNPLAKNELQCATLMCIAGLSFPEPLLQSLDLHSSLNSCVFVTRIITPVTIKQYIPNSSSQR